MGPRNRERELDLEKTDVALAVGLVFVAVVILYFIAQIIRWAVR